MDPLKLLSPSYLMDTTPGSDFSFLYLGAILCLILILAGLAIQIITHFARKMDPAVKKRLKRAPFPLFLFGWGGLVLLWFRYEGAPFLSMRLFPLLLMLGFIWWLIVYILSFGEIGRSRAEHAHAEAQKRYKP